VSYCGEVTKVKTGREFGIAASLLCKKASCPTCWPNYKRKVARIAASGRPDAMITFTMRSPYEGGPLAMRAAFAELIPKFFAACAAHAGHKLAYFAMCEAHDSGWPHVHVLVRGWSFIHWRRYSAIWRELSGCTGVDVKRIANRAGAVKYVVKYLGKGPAKYGTFKLYWRSLDWVLDPPATRRIPLCFAGHWEERVVPWSTFMAEWWAQPNHWFNHRTKACGWHSDRLDREIEAASPPGRREGGAWQ
jgi:hypothetical protein